MKADIRVIVKGVQQYADYIDEIVTNAIGKYSIVNGLHIVEYRELCKGGHIIENKLVINLFVYTEVGVCSLKCLS